MAKQYRLYYDDENYLLVDPSQAGNRVSCPNGKEIEVPKYRELIQLELDQQATEANTVPTSGWSISHAAIFLGLTIFLAAGGAGLYKTIRPSHPVFSTEEVIEHNSQFIDQATLTETFQLWKNEIEATGIEFRRSPYADHYNLQSQQQSRWQMTFFVIAGIGLALALGTFLLSLALAKRPAGETAERK